MSLPPACAGGQARLRLRRRSQTVLRTPEETYLRHDVSCGSPLCASCAPPSRLGSDARFLLFVDGAALAEWHELLALTDVYDFVLLASGVRTVLAASSRVAQRVRSLYSDLRRSVHLLHDAHSAAVAEQREQLLQSGLLPETPHLSALSSAAHYACHLAPPFPLHVLASNDAAAERLRCLQPLFPAGVSILSPSEVFGRDGVFGVSSAVRELFESLQESRAAAATLPPQIPSAAAAAQLSEAALEAGLSGGTLLRGVLSVSQRHPECATVRCGACTVLLPTKASRANALHGDTVAVRLLPASQWVAPPSAAASSFDAEETSASWGGGGGGTEGGEGDAGEAGLDGPSASPDSDSDSELLDTPSGQLPTGELAGILQRCSLECVASVSADDCAAIAALGPLSAAQQAAAAPARLLCVPRDRRLPLIRLRTRRAAELCGSRFLLRVDGWTLGDPFPEAHLLKLLGPAGSLEAELAALLAEHAVQTSPFCPGALEELPPPAQPGQRWRPSPAEAHCPGRRDCTHMRAFSIDPPGCTDVDDALSVCEREDGRPGYTVGVHIADVSHFIRAGGMLDAEAGERGTTVYLVDRRFDMLPPLLSEDACSLLAGVERLAVGVLWQVGPDGVPDPGAAVWAGRTLIRSKAQLSYNQAQSLLDSGAAEGVGRDEAPQLLSDLRVLVSFAAALREQREPGCGASLAEEAAGMSTLAAAASAASAPLELASAEVRFRLDDSGVPRSALAKETLPVMAVVAEAMIGANSAVASIIRRVFPAAALLRRHAPPRPEGLLQLSELAAAAGVSFNARLVTECERTGGDARAAFAAELARCCKGLPDSGAGELIRAQATRCMSEAEYTCVGAGPGPYDHFGLGLQDYTHFTSPIRRYADVLVHRQLILALQQNTSESASAALSVSSVSAAAAILNERHRASKRAQKGCCELYFLTMLRAMEEEGGCGVVEAAVVEALRPPHALRLFVPRFHIRATVRVVSDEGVVRPPLLDGDAADPTGWAVAHFDASSLELCNSSSGVQVRYAPLQKVWLSLSAGGGGAAHSLRLRATLLHEEHPRVAAAEEEERARVAGEPSRRHKKAALEGPAPQAPPTPPPQVSARRPGPEGGVGRLTAAQLARAVRQEPGQTVVTEEEKEAPPAVRGLEGVGEAARAELEAGAAAIAAAALRPGSARYADACARAAEARAVADALWRRTGLN